MSKKEIWKPIPGYPGYEASNLGQIRSWKTSKGIAKAPKILTCGIDTNGYRRCGAVDQYGVKKAKRIHILIMLAFRGSRPEGKHVCHNDGNRLNNNLTNLRYDTPASNHQDAVKHGTIKIFYGEDHPLSKLSEQDILSIRNLYATGHVTQRELSEKYRVARPMIHYIVTGKTWQQVGGPISTNNWKPATKRLEVTKEQQLDEARRQRKMAKWERIKEMRVRYASGNFSLSEMARLYNVSESFISYIVNGKRCTEAGGPIKGIDY